MNWRVLIILFPILFGINLGFSQSFVQVKNGHFYYQGQPYYFIGANLWYGMHLGAPGSGNQVRLLRELDLLKSLGVTNLRIMACSDGPDASPWRVHPVLQAGPGQYSEDLWQGLDFLLYEMGKREMKAVICLTNFWPWSGGMAQYVAWSDGSKIPYPPPAKNGSWLQYQLYVSRFYGDTKAISWYHEHIRQLVSRRNHCSGILYRDDPVVMAWQLANEPRAILQPRKYRQWIQQTGELIKQLDPNHLVTIGSEGNTSSRWSGNRFYLDHQMEAIDYCTIHFWAENWGWYDPKQPEQTFQFALDKMNEYLSAHLEVAKQLGKPLVFEEFGLARDHGSYEVNSPIGFRDQFYRQVFQRLKKEMGSGNPFCGTNFWAWSGEGNPISPGDYWQPGDDLLGDPPHERQGWYGVYTRDTSTLSIIAEFASQLNSSEP